MRKLSIALLGILFATSAMADAMLSNKDSRSYKLVLGSSESCSGGLHTSIESNTTKKVQEGWACLNAQKPAVKLEKNKEYIVKNGGIQAK